MGSSVGSTSCQAGKMIEVETKWANKQFISEKQKNVQVFIRADVSQHFDTNRQPSKLESRPDYLAV